MKKPVIVTLCNVILALCILTCFLIVKPYSNTLEAATFNQSTTLDTLKNTTENLSSRLSALEQSMKTHENTVSTMNLQITDIKQSYETLERLLVDYYIDHLKDPNYYTYYNTDYIYYTAAENLGLIGKAAIPDLIEKLSTSDDYERALVLYALLLASQSDNVKVFTDGHYIETYLDFDPQSHASQIQIALTWWETYQHYF